MLAIIAALPFIGFMVLSLAGRRLPGKVIALVGAGTVSLAGSTWEVWLSNGNENGSSRTISYRRGQNNTALTNFDAMAFINDAVSRGVAQRSWYVTSVGFEIWSGGTNLRVSSFSVGAQ